MTAPYKRFSVPGGMGSQLDRIRKLELGHGNLPYDDGILSTYAETGFGPFFSSEDGTNVSGISMDHSASLIQDQVVILQFIVGAFGGFSAGTGSTYLIGLNPSATLRVVWVNPLGVQFQAVLGSGYAYDFSADAYTAVLFRGSDKVCPVRNPKPGVAYQDGYNIEAVNPVTGDVVGPGAPYSWASGDILMTGTIALQLVPFETLPQLPLPP